MWRYLDVLPVTDPAQLDLSSAGGTPLLLSRRYARNLELPNLYIKDERYGPTSSFKDRQAALAVVAMY
jgi:threonine synthase